MRLRLHLLEVACFLSFWGRVGVRALCLKWCFFFRGKPGLGPAAELLFFASPKKSSQKKGEPKTGALRASLCCSVRGEKFANLSAARPSDSELLFSPHPCAAQPGLTAGERERGHPHPSPLPPAGEGARHARRRGSPNPLPFAPFCPCRGAQRQADKGCACLSEASLRRPRLARAPQVARSEAEGHGRQGRLFFAYFLLAKQKKVSRPPGRDPACHERRTTPSNAKEPSPHPSPRGRESKRKPQRPRYTSITRSSACT